MAGEILSALSASGAAKSLPDAPDETRTLSVREPAQDEAFSEARSTLPAARFTAYALPLREERGLFREPSAPAVQTPDAEALSELFRRDSRRYDGGFERF